ncbi:MAG: hypothetical protein WC303_00865 [Candidatus Paceibacterota bacterium]|jgi:hypothetical protein
MLSFEVSERITPCLYEISYVDRDGQPVLLLKIHKDFVRKYKNIMPIRSFLYNFQRMHNLEEFSPFGKKYFGFDKSFKLNKITKNFIEYEIEIPVFRKRLPQVCEHCKGSGRDEDFDRKCSWCDGSGFKILYDWKPFHAICSSLQIFANMAEIFDGSISTKNNQLLTFKLVCGEGQGHYPISGSYGVEFCNWLNTMPDYYEFKDVILAMWNVHTHIYNRDAAIYCLSFEAHVRSSAWLILSCPGDACGIFPVDSWEPGKGMEFECHNMDTPIQQILLLVGLAVLSDLSKKHMK